jgi:hypothetical protein
MSALPWFLRVVRPGTDQSVDSPAGLLQVGPHRLEIGGDVSAKRHVDGVFTRVDGEGDFVEGRLVGGWLVTGRVDSPVLAERVRLDERADATIDGRR